MREAERAQSRCSRPTPQKGPQSPLSEGRRSLTVHACLASEAMGDHAGVDFAQSGHAGLLEAHGLLQPAYRLDGRRPVPSASRFELLCIDDYVSLGRVAAPELHREGEEPTPGPDLEAFDRALDTYDRVGLEVRDTRVVGIADSRTSLGSVLKGRSASRAIRRTLQLTNPLLLAGGLQVAMLFGPKRPNVADDATRYLEVRAPCREPPSWTQEAEIYLWVCSRPPLPRVLAAWGRLFLDLAPLEACAAWRACMTPAWRGMAAACTRRWSRTPGARAGYGRPSSRWTSAGASRTTTSC